MTTITRIRNLLEDAHLYNIYAKKINTSKYYRIKCYKIMEAIKIINRTKTYKAKYTITYDTVYHNISCVGIVFTLVDENKKYSFHIPTGIYMKHLIVPPKI